MKIACIHPYIEQRRAEIQKGLFPRNHLWGIEAIEKKEGWDANLLSNSKHSIPNILEKFLNRVLFRSSPGAGVEINAWKAFKSCDVVFSICGPLSLARFRKSSKLVSWVFSMVEEKPIQYFHPYKKSNLSSHEGFLCLTPKAERDFSNYASSKFIPWCVDMKLFDGKSENDPPAGPFFLATGKTGRDYETLVEASRLLNAEVRIIGPISQRPDNTPPNVNWISSSSDPPDQAIDYPTLRKWYSQCKAVCIPLSGNAQDTCGYTNLLEGMAMAKPVIMTRSGCLHINPEKGDFGFSIAPQNPKSWADAMNSVLQNPRKSEVFGKKGRKIAERDFSIEHFERSTISFLQKIIETPS